nr:hypothetical protein B8B20.190 [imported] - Neurospora crassa [Neurospora crassa]
MDGWMDVSDDDTTATREGGKTESHAHWILDPGPRTAEADFISLSPPTVSHHDGDPALTDPVPLALTLHDIQTF